MKTLTEIRDYAYGAHAAVNHKYDDMPYSYHLGETVVAAIKFIQKYDLYKSIPAENLEIIFAACYCHDLIEDTRQSYNDVIVNTESQFVADIVYAVSNEKGKTRLDRANDNYYKGIREQQYASFVKLCDRFVNVQYAIYTQSHMLQVYINEHNHFIEAVTTENDKITYAAIIKELAELYEKDPSNLNS